MKCPLVFTIFLVFLLEKCLSEELPDFLHVCKRNDPDLENCLIKAVVDLKPILIEDATKRYMECLQKHNYYPSSGHRSSKSNGFYTPKVPKAKYNYVIWISGNSKYGIPSIEPFTITDLKTGDVSNLMLNIKNIKAYGGSNFNIKSVKFNFDKMESTLDLEIPNLHIEAEYLIIGKLLTLPVNGEGLFFANISGVSGHAIMKGEVIEKNGENYMKYHTVDLKVKLTKGEVKLEDKKAGEALSKIFNDAANKNFKEFSKELLPAIQKGLATVFLDVGNDIIKHFTVDQLFPA